MKTASNKFFFLIFLFVWTFAGLSKAKPDSLSAGRAGIIIKTRTGRDSVVLRWAVNDPGGWFTANKEGFIIEKAQVDSGSNFVALNYIKINKEPIKPWTLPEWKSRTDKNNHYAAIAAQALYGKNFIPKSMLHGGKGNLINSANDLKNRYGFAMFAADNDALTAEGLGLRITDKNVKEGRTYVYRVFPAVQDSSNIIDTAYAVVKVLPYKKSPAPYDLKLIQGDGSVKLTWRDIRNESYSGYYVYRSDDNVNFKRMNNVPIVLFSSVKERPVHQYTFIDTTVVNYRKYYYRVRGVTPFAELSKFAEVSGSGKDLTAPPKPVVDKPLQINMHSVELKWKYPDNVPDLKGFVIARGNNPKKGLSLLVKKPLPKNVRIFIDDSATTDEPFYKVGAIDTAGNIAGSFAVYVTFIDSLPPSRPQGLTGSIDTNGIVKLHWKLGPEKDIIGYRVLWANSPKHEFTVEPGAIVKDTAFTDSVDINTLTRYIYFKVAAVNSRYNESVPSKILALKRPDIIPPASPAFKSVFVTDRSVKLTWAPSPSKDVMFQKLMRSNDKNTWTEIDSFNNKTKNYIDTNVVQDKIYEYRLAVSDSDNNKTLSSIVLARPYDTGVRPSPVITLVKYDSTKKDIFIRWKYKSTKNEHYYFVLFKSKAGNIPSSYKALKSSVNSFYDFNLTGKGIYKYSIKVKSYNGAESPLSKAAEIIIK